MIESYGDAGEKTPGKTKKGQRPSFYRNAFVLVFRILARNSRLVKQVIEKTNEKITKIYFYSILSTVGGRTRNDESPARAKAGGLEKIEIGKRRYVRQKGKAGSSLSIPFENGYRPSYTGSRFAKDVRRSRPLFKEMAQKTRRQLKAGAFDMRFLPFHKDGLDLCDVDHRQILLVRLLQAHKQSRRRVQGGDAGGARFHRITAD